MAYPVQPLHSAACRNSVDPDVTDIINGVNYDCRALEEVVGGVAGVELS